MSPFATLRWWARWFIEGLFGSRWRALNPDDPTEALYSDFGYLRVRRKPLFGGREFRDRSLFKQLKPRKIGDNVIAFKRSPAEYRAHNIPLPQPSSAAREMDLFSARLFDGRLKVLRDPAVDEAARRSTLYGDFPAMKRPLAIGDVDIGPDNEHFSDLKEQAMKRLRDLDLKWQAGDLCAVWFAAGGAFLDPSIKGTQAAGTRMLRVVLFADPPPERRLEWNEESKSWFLIGPFRWAKILGRNVRDTVSVPTMWLREPTHEELREWRENQTIR